MTLGLALLALPLVLPVSSARAAETERKVLVLYSTRQDTQFSITGDRDLKGLIERGLGQPIDYYSEYIDGARFPDAQYRAAWREYIRLKYAASPPDVIIATHRLAHEFLYAFRDQVLPGAPVVFLTDDADAPRMPNSTGLIVAQRFPETVALARQLQPTLKRIFVVSGSSARDRVFELRARAEFATATMGVQITYLSGLTLAELERQIANLPADSIVLYLMFYQDAAGVNVTPMDYLERLAAMSNQPIYSWVEAAIGRVEFGIR